MPRWSVFSRGESGSSLSITFREDIAHAIPTTVPFVQGDVGDTALVKRVVREADIESCIHFASFAYVAESVEQPGLYFENNLTQGLALFASLLESGVKRVVFSSSCTTYGEPTRLPVSEDSPQCPTSPYGWTKLLLERALAAYDAAYGMKFAVLRYFNAAGATEKCGEDHHPETHLIPSVLRAAAGVIPEVCVFGDSYPTPDHTAIRDYVHINDLADAHNGHWNIYEAGQFRIFELGQPARMLGSGSN